MAIFKKLSKKNNDVVLETIKDSRTISLSKYDKGLKKSRDSFTKKIKLLATKHREINEAYFEDLEEILIMSDVGALYTINLIEEVKKEVRLKNITEPADINEMIFDMLFEKYLDDDNIEKLNIVEGELNVIFVIGVNGVGKTTSVGKITNKLKNDGYKVTLAAADTFRAGAVAQLNEWAIRNDVEIATPDKEGQDPASVVFKAIEIAKNNESDILIVDTAGRLQNKVNLMNELSKMEKIIERETGKKPVETILVLDATTGQNGVAQAASFNEVAKLTGIFLTKMDSSAKGGIILQIKETFNIPVKFIGLGESIDDIEEFDLSKYLHGLIMGSDDE